MFSYNNVTYYSKHSELELEYFAKKTMRKIKDTNIFLETYEILQDMIHNNLEKYYQLVKQKYLKTRNPVSLDSITFTQLTNDYIISDKIDGRKVQMLISTYWILELGSHLEVIEKRRNNYFRLEKGHYAILEGEKLSNKYYIYDIIYYKDQLLQETYLERLKILQLFFDVSEIEFIECNLEKNQIQNYYKNIDDKTYINKMIIKCDSCIQEGMSTLYVF